MTTIPLSVTKESPLAPLDKGGMMRLQVAGEGEEWGRARGLWLASRRAGTTRRIYEAALDGLLFYAGKGAWEIVRSDVIGWVEAMKGQRLASTTVQQKLAAVSSFYAFVSTEYTRLDSAGRETPLHPSNPAAGKTLRPKVTPYGKATWLGDEQVRALLSAIDRSTARGKRDYALLLGYILTGRRNSEWRLAKWGDFEVTSGTVYYRWEGKGKTDQKLELPPPVWEAVIDFLQAAGRKPKANDAIFQPMTDNALHLPGVKAETWTREKAISLHEANRILKRYCRRAGLDAGRMHVHTLRHTAAMLRKQAGDTLEDIQQFLGHSSLAVTQIYLHALEGRRDRSWGKVAEILGIEKTSFEKTGHVISLIVTGGKNEAARYGPDAKWCRNRPGSVGGRGRNDQNPGQSRPQTGK